MITEYELYSDERKVHHPRGTGQYLFLGGLVCTDTGAARLLRTLAELRAERGLTAEMKWVKVSRSYLGAYQAWVDAFFEDPYAR